MATTLREELENIFDRFNEFTHLGERYDFKEDLAHIPRLQFAKQISDAFQPKLDDDTARKKVDDWLKTHLAAASLKITADEKGVVPKWNEYVKFKDAYALLIRRLLTDLNKLYRTQKWLDPKDIAETVNNVDLRQMWREKEGQMTASVIRALASVILRR